ncbi:hypothetical protein K438DRAFT_2073414 [Mycena galopus ATCC 62051]|nr:hypothetical protein K438DRAFT_2073414 [Mycena galopus ATCC 62051]
MNGYGNAASFTWERRRARKGERVRIHRDDQRRGRGIVSEEGEKADEDQVASPSQRKDGDEGSPCTRRQNSQIQRLVVLKRGQANRAPTPPPGQSRSHAKTPPSRRRQAASVLSGARRSGDFEKLPAVGFGIEENGPENLDVRGSCSGPEGVMVGGKKQF